MNCFFSVATVRVRNPFVYTQFVQPIRMNPNFIGAGVSALAMGIIDQYLIDVL
jgi:hypothetical protein